MVKTKHVQDPRRSSKRHPRLISALLVGITLCAALMLSAPEAMAGRSGGSFGGRMFRSSGGFSSAPRAGYGRGYAGGGRPSFFFLPSFGWGWGGMGYGGGFGSLMVLAVLGIAAFSLVRAARRHRGGQTFGAWGSPQNDEDDDDDVGVAGRAYVYRMQVALGRSARGIQDRLARFATDGDSATEAGLAALLQQTALELLREKDSIRAAAAEGSGPLSLTNAETKLTGLALTERSRFQVERVRSADGHLRRSEVAPEEGKEALEYVVVTLVVATRKPLGAWKGITDHSDVESYLGQLGAVSSSGLLGLEVIWTPADPDDSLTEIDMMTTYPDLRTV